ncbi:MAG: HAD family hydrolase [Deltaproteobacteria bacterium]|nr:HAD family hydrolase [Deltaproteobacteria bacterium]
MNDAFDAVFSRFQSRKITFEESNSYVGVPLEGLLGKLFGEENEDEAITIFRNRYKDVCFEKTSLIKGAKELLLSLKEEKKSLSVATNKTGSISRKLLEHLEIDGLFDYVYGVFDGLEGKPSPEMIDKIVEKTSIPKTSTILIGDSPIDIMTAKNAGIHICSVASGNHTFEELKTYNPNYLYAAISELSRIHNNGERCG